MRDKYFFNQRVNILENAELREPQIDAYIAIYDHFAIKKKDTEAIVVLPTGAGKTGLMALAPFFISEGRVLIIAPQLTILDTLENALSTDKSSNFWTARKVISDARNLPRFAVYNGSNSNNSGVADAEIVLANIQKMQSVHDTSLINKYPEDYFDMILIDEAHHSSAQSWIDVVNHFKNAKVVKITATPYRTDKKPLTGELVYKYNLSQAMSKGYIKSLEKFNYIPEELLLAIDGDDENLYTVEEIKSKGYSDDWIAKSVSYSDACKRSVINKSLEVLYEKRKNTNVPHKIIAAAPSIKEAKKIAEMYNENAEIKAVAVYHELETNDRERILSEIENNRVDVVVNVSMMGEGYDHKYLSVAAIFRVFKNILPYEQFIGRILRAIPENEMETPEDNIGSVVVHKNLNLDDLWEYYREQLQEYAFIKDLEEHEDPEDPEPTDGPNQNNIVNFGVATEQGVGSMQRDVYMKTDYIKLKEENDKIRQKKIDELSKIMPNMTVGQLEDLLDTEESTNTLLNRPDKLVAYRQKTTDKNIREQIVPELLAKNGYEIKGSDLKNLSIFFNPKYKWITNPPRESNGAFLAIYFNYFLKSEIGRSRNEWTNADFEKAATLLESQKKYIDELMKG